MTGNFSDPGKYPCPGCQDGYFVGEVVNILKWTMTRLPIDKFDSLILHGPSPLHCIASGNVWYDNPAKTSCLSHKAVARLYPDPHFDWDHFQKNPSGRFCLRLSASGFESRLHLVIE
jgi:hypothetical protein